MFIHCNRRFKPQEVWFLFDNKNFTERKLQLGICPICDNDLIKLSEIRISDGKYFEQVFSKKKAEKVVEKLINEVNYTSRDIKKFKGTPYGLCYGENKEIHNCKGEIVEIRQRSCDFFGSKEIVKTIKIYTS